MWPSAQRFPAWISLRAPVVPRWPSAYIRGDVSTSIQRAAAFALLALGLVACAAAPPPTHKLSDSKAAVRAAEEVGAGEAPQAALHLKLARDQIASAERLMRDDENEDARYMLERAEADAELAIALAKAAGERAAAEDAMRKVERLKRQSE